MRIGDRAETVEELLSEARRELARVSPREALDATQDGAILVDIRSDSSAPRTA